MNPDTHLLYEYMSDEINDHLCAITYRGYSVTDRLTRYLPKIQLP